MNTKSNEQTADQAISADRGNSYGDFREMATLAQLLKDNAVSDNMTPVQKESMELICTKIARLAVGDCNHIDSWVDIAGYANLVVKDITNSRPPATLNMHDPWVARMLGMRNSLAPDSVAQHASDSNSVNQSRHGA